MVLCNVQSAFADDAKWTNKGIATFGEAITSLDNLSDGYYVLRNVGRKTFVKAEGENLMLRPAVQSTNFADFKNFFSYNTDVAYVFYLKKSATEMVSTLSKERLATISQIQARETNHFLLMQPNMNTPSITLMVLHLD